MIMFQGHFDDVQKAPNLQTKAPKVVKELVCIIFSKTVSYIRLLKHLMSSRMDSASLNLKLHA